MMSRSRSQGTEVTIVTGALSLLFTSCYTMEAFLIFFILLLFDSSVFAKHSVMY